MQAKIRRRDVLGGALAAAAVTGIAPGQGRVVRTAGSRYKLGLNAYSFDRPLKAGTTTLDDLVRYCAEHGIDSLDATGYYFPGYPKVPDDDAIFRLKRAAFLNGVALSGTGVRNDFTLPDAARRKEEIQLVKNWIEVASKLGAPVIRVFTGPKMPEGHTFEQVLEWMIPAFLECADCGQKHGVLVGLQNHNDFAKTAEQTIRIINAVNSKWFGSILDVGSLRENDPYEEIERLLPYAVSWQLKELVGYGTREVPTDLAKVRSLIDRGGYRGYLPVETLGPGDPAAKVAVFIEQVRKAFGLS
ncbi:MAG TPA: sugar phosphate isomerase/epimerase family protein [Bryobacteraceae bacterium]|nr:sugar phosphate isomerase/epimerase family protein [Bryobacteraceae bacterium]